MNVATAIKHLRRQVNEARFKSQEFCCRNEMESKGECWRTCMTAIFEQRDHAEVNPIIERTIVQEFGRPIPEDIVAIETPKPPGAKSSKTSKKRVAPKTESDEDAAPPGE